MTKRTKYIAFLTVGGLCIIYMLLFPLARNGYGYIGYYGFHRGPSWWYFDRYSSLYLEPSNRSGSVSGTERIGGGPGSGK